MNHAIRVTAATLGVIFAIGGMSHGLFEILQGNTPTNGLMIEAISESHRFWEHGAEGALTVLPTFLVSGIAVFIVAGMLILWSLRYLHTRHGASVYLGLFVALFLVGGGVGQVIFFIPAWAFATRINAPLTGWRRILPDSLRPTLARLWPYTLVGASIAIVLTLYLAVFGYIPGITAADQVLAVMIVGLLSAWVLFMVSFVCGIARDVTRQDVSLVAAPAA